MASWTAPKTYVAGSQLTAAELNTYLRDNPIWLKDALALHGITSDTARQQLDGALFGVRARRTANQSTTHQVEAVIDFTAADDFDSNAMHDTGTNPDRVTVPAGEGGVFTVGWHLDWAANTSGNRRGWLKLNGATEIPGSELRLDSPAASVTVGMGLATAYLFSAGDYVTLSAYQTSGGALNVAGATLWMLRHSKS